MATAIMTVSLNFGGEQSSGSKTITYESGIEHGGGGDILLAAGVAGTLSTRTNNAEGVITLAGGHGLSTGTFDVYWSTGSRHQVSATIVSNDATISDGSGDNLPTQDTAVVFSPRTEIDTDVDGDKVRLLWISGSGKAGVEFTENDDTNLLNIVVPAQSPYQWEVGTFTISPLAGMIVGKIYASAATTAATTVRVCIGYNS